MIQSFVTLIPLFVSGILTIEIALTLRSRPMPALQWLLLWAATTTSLYAGHYIYFNHITPLLPWTDTIYTTCNLSVYPLYLLYILRLTSHRPPRWAYCILALPLIAGTMTAILYFLMDETATTQFFNTYLYQMDHTPPLQGLPLWQQRFHDLFKMLFAAEVLATAHLGIRAIRRHNLLVESLYADTEGKTLNRLRTILLLLIATSLVSFAANIIGKACFAHHIWRLAIPSILFSALIFAIGWTGINQQFSIDDMVTNKATNNPTLLGDNQPLLTDNPPLSADNPPLPKDSEPALHHTTQPSTANSQPPAANSQLSAANSQQIIDRLTLLMQTERLYLQHGLKLDDVAQRLGTNRTYLLQAINEHHHATFSAYINRLRIQYALQQQKDYPHYSKEAIAFQSGFASVSSFYRNLRLYQGDSAISS